MSLVDRVRERVRGLFGEMSEEVSVRNLSAAEALRQFGIEAIAEIVKLLQIEGGTGADKKAAAMKLVDEFYTLVIEPIDLPGPDALIDPIGRKVVAAMADYAIDGLIAWMKTISVDSTVKAFRESE